MSRQCGEIWSWKIRRVGPANSQKGSDEYDLRAASGILGLGFAIRRAYATMCGAQELGSPSVVRGARLAKDIASLKTLPR
ncbi:MAG: hypothetical protein ACI9HK_000420 [Pirellulaceae bacterium]|jgi:hypothetical protein